MFSSICKEFEGIRQRALKVPEDTREMTDMMKFIKDAKTARLVKLNEQIKVRDRIIFTMAIFHSATVLQCNFCPGKPIAA